MFYDRIFVFEDGKIVEKDKPGVLLRDEQSRFRKMVEENGPEFMKRMLEMTE